MRLLRRLFCRHRAWRLADYMDDYLAVLTALRLRQEAYVCSKCGVVRIRAEAPGPMEEK